MQAIGTEDRDHDKKRVFYSDVKDDNPLECIVGNVNVVRVPSLVNTSWLLLLSYKEMLLKISYL
jgi:hypothetical protein